jgi:SAM-dependent methyltransferase
MTSPPPQPGLSATTAISTGDERFEFGRNWSRFLATVDEKRISAARESLRRLLGETPLASRRFLDAGCGSGLFSLAAHLEGAEVVSFDYDPQCVACTHEMQRRFGDANGSPWRIERGSLLDETYLRGLGEFDVVYCWGVAHHTGAMWSAIENLWPAVRPGGRIVLAIYNDQQYISRLWAGIKRVYQKLPGFLRPVYVAGIGAVLFAWRLLVTLMASALRLVTFRNPFVPFLNWARETQARGMHGWYDLVDWVGGWPFEVARPEELFRYLRDRGFRLTELVTCSGHGCNELVFEREARSAVKD